MYSFPQLRCIFLRRRFLRRRGDHHIRRGEVSPRAISLFVVVPSDAWSADRGVSVAQDVRIDDGIEKGEYMGCGEFGDRCNGAGVLVPPLRRRERAT